MSSRTVLFLGLVTVLTLLSCKEAPEKQSEVASAELSGNLYMDIHRNVDGLTAEAVTGAHQKDLEVQEKYGVNYLKYWYDEESGTVFCLVDAPSKEAAARVHKEAHGLVADEVIEVKEGIKGLGASCYHQRGKMAVHNSVVNTSGENRQ